MWESLGSSIRPADRGLCSADADVTLGVWLTASCMVTQARPTPPSEFEHPFSVSLGRPTGLISTFLNPNVALGDGALRVAPARHLEHWQSARSWSLKLGAGQTPRQTSLYAAHFWNPKQLALEIALSDRISRTQLRKALIPAPDSIDKQLLHSLVGEKTNAAVKEPDDDCAHGNRHIGPVICMPLLT